MNDINCWEEKFELCVYTEKLLAKLELLNQKAVITNQVNIKEIKKAIYYAKKYHGEQRRLSGEPYYSHPLAVAELVAPYCFKTDILVASILHDVIEDTILTKEMISKIFNLEIARNVESLTRVKHKQKITSAKLIELLLIENNHDLLMVKFFDRIHNIKTLQSKSFEAQERIVLETLKDFLPIATYYSLLHIEKQLGELCFEQRSKYFPAEEPVYIFDLEENYQLLSQVFQNVELPTYSL